MENYEYSKTFSPSAEEDIDRGSTEAKEILNLIHAHERDLIEHPKFLIPFAPKIFEETVAKCELIVKEFSGKIKAEVNYSTYEATIDLWCVYVDFDRGEFMEILHDITHKALSIRFEPLTSGDLHIRIYMPYFILARMKNEEG